MWAVVESRPLWGRGQPARPEPIQETQYKIYMYTRNPVTHIRHSVHRAALRRDKTQLVFWITTSTKKRGKTILGEKEEEQEKKER